MFRVKNFLLFLIEPKNSFLNLSAQKLLMSFNTNSQFQLVADSLKNLKGKTLILTHHNADIDAAASAIGLQLGLAQIGIQVSVGVCESFGRPTKKICEGREILIDPDCADFENIILVETSVPEQLQSVKNLRADIIIDHHPPAKLTEKAKAVFIDESAKSCSQLVYKFLAALDCKINPELAKILACGLIADSQHLRIAELPEFKILVELLEAGITYEEAQKMIQTDIDKSELIATLRAASRMRIYKIADLVLVFTRVGSFEAQACRGLIRMGADIAIVVDEKKEEVRISSRAKPWIEKFGIDLSEIFKKVGALIGGTGGGHPTAGSANGFNKKGMADAEDFILKSIAKKVGEPYKKLD